MSHIKDRCLIIFARYPEKGQVKSRLARDYDEKFVADLYGHFVDDLLSTLGRGNYCLKIAFHPPEKYGAMKERFGGSHEYMRQCSGNLGEKMRDAFQCCFTDQFRSVILIGSDCPDLDVEVIHSSFEALEKTADAAIGPAHDGGYYLIGFRADAFHPGIFNDMPWGEPSVYRETMKKIESENIRIQLAPAWHDIDTRADLEALVRKHLGSPFRHLKTMTFVQGSRTGRS